MNKKIFLSFLTLTFLVAGVFLFFNTTKAKTDPKNNTLCWTTTECNAERARKGWVGNGAIKDENTCPGYQNDDITNPGAKWVKCLAGGITTAQVSFGGKETFADIGDYIKTIYNYLLIILSILASVMIVVAGVQYVSSAGNQETIGNAKKRIIGAIIGLALAYMSYTILNIVNPNTVNLRLPQVYLVRAIPLPDTTEKMILQPCNPKESDADSKCQGLLADTSAYCQPLGSGGLTGPCTKPITLMTEAIVGWAGDIIEMEGKLSSPVSLGVISIAGVPWMVYKINGFLFTEGVDTSAGVCIKPDKAVPVGGFCDLDGKKSLCKSPGKCVKLDAVSVGSCWTGGNIGFCSDGRKNSICNTSADCKEGLGCKVVAKLPGGDMMACTDGTAGSSCFSDNDCLDVCVKKSSEIGFCAATEVTYDGSCTDSQQCSGGSKCVVQSVLWKIHKQADNTYSSECMDGTGELVSGSVRSIDDGGGGKQVELMNNESRGVCLLPTEYTAEKLIQTFSIWKIVETGQKVQCP